MQTFLFISSDPGVTRALVPVARQLYLRKHTVMVGSSEISDSIWQTEANFNLISKKFDDDISEEKVKRVLEKIFPDLIVVGAGLYNMIEHTFRKVAVEMGIYCFAMLDFWAGYRSRFQRVINDKCVVSLPDKIGIMDELCFNEMVEDAFDPDSMVIVGAPHLEESVKIIHSSSSIIEKIEHEIIFAFFSVSMPGFDNNEISKENGLGLMPPWGFTQHTILIQIINGLSAMCDKYKQSVQLLVKPHPLEPQEALERTIRMTKKSQYLDCQMVLSHRSAELICTADIILGTTSTALLESSLAGKPTLSIQIGTQEKYDKDIFYGNKVGLTIPIYEKIELEKSFEKILSGKKINVPLTKINFTGSAVKTAETIVKLANTHNGINGKKTLLT